MLVPFLLPAARRRRQPWGRLSLSALRPPGRARAHSPGLIYFFKGGSFILVGLGGKEGWGFCKVSTTRPVNFPQVSFFLPLALLPSFFLFPGPPGPTPGLLRLSVPTLPPHSSFLCVSGFSLPFLPSGFQSRWEKGWRVGGAARGGRGWAALTPPTGSRRPPPPPRSRPGKGLGPGVAGSVVCRRATCIDGEAAGGAGVGGGGRGKANADIY